MEVFTNNLKISSIIPVIDNEHDFTFIRDHLSDKPTKAEHQITSRIAKIIDPQGKDAADDPLIQIRLRQKSKWIEKLIILYKHEAQLESYKKKIFSNCGIALFQKHHS
jgi:hypothetical protein